MDKSLLTEAEKRDEDRRDSPRIPASFFVKELTLGGAGKERVGNISMGGAFWRTEDQPLSGRVEIRFKPEPQTEVRAVADIIRVREIGTEFGVHVRFQEVELEHELKLARFIDSQVRAGPIGAAP